MNSSRKNLTLLSVLMLAVQCDVLYAQEAEKQTESVMVPAAPSPPAAVAVTIEAPVTDSAEAASPPEIVLPAELAELINNDEPRIDVVDQIRLYAMPCGTAQFADFGAFSDTGEYEGKAQDLITSCYLIRHPKGDLIWDLGLGDAIAEQPDGVNILDGQILLKVENPLLPQLAQVNVHPEDVEFIAFSHLHFDHTGNANAFSKSTWLMNELEWTAARAKPTPVGVEPKNLSGHKQARLKMIKGDHDVFGDGRVRILSAPGHTPGHQVLMVELDEFGTVILSGDLYHTRENRTDRRIPGINHDRADTLASMDRIEQWVRNRKAMFVIQHVPEELEKLPRFPDFLD